MYNDSLFNAFARSFEARSQTDMSMAEYLESCRSDPMRYANAAERLLAAIGEPQMIDTAKDPRLGRIFLNRTIRSYPAFAGFFGMEDTIECLVGFFRHAAQGLEERKQILYLLGPVGGGKSSLAERIKALMEIHPIYVLKAGDELSPVFESPLGLFDPEQLGPMIEEKYGIPRRRLSGSRSRGSGFGLGRHRCGSGSRLGLRHGRGLGHRGRHLGLGRDRRSRFGCRSVGRGSLRRSRHGLGLGLGRRGDLGVLLVHGKAFLLEDVGDHRIDAGHHVGGIHEHHGLEQGRRHHVAADGHAQRLEQKLRLESRFLAGGAAELL